MWIRQLLYSSLVPRLSSLRAHIACLTLAFYADAKVIKINIITHAREEGEPGDKANYTLHFTLSWL